MIFSKNDFRGILLTFFTLAKLIDDAFTTVPCPNGDTAGIIKDGKTCSELTAADNAECYDNAIETSCCTSCNDVARANQNCLYGDKTGCFTFLCPSYTDINSCCETCASFITTQSSTSTSLTVSTPGSTDGQTTNTNEGSNNDGMIAGAVVGSIVGLILLVIGAFIAFKILKKKHNKIEDGTSSEILDKVDKSSGFIPEKVDICTVLQEQLDTSSDLSEKQVPIEKSNNDKCNNNSDQNKEKACSKEQNSKINNGKLKTKKQGLTDVTYHVNNGDDDIRRHSLPPLKESDVESTPLHDVLPPIGVSANNPHVGDLSNNTETTEIEHGNGKHDKGHDKRDNLSPLTNESKKEHQSDKTKVPRRSEFIFPSFM